jgi:hypothetical protein
VGKQRWCLWWLKPCTMKSTWSTVIWSTGSLASRETQAIISFFPCLEIKDNNTLSLPPKKLIEKNSQISSSQIHSSVGYSREKWGKRFFGG